MNFVLKILILNLPIFLIICPIVFFKSFNLINEVSKNISNCFSSRCCMIKKVKIIILSDENKYFCLLLFGSVYELEICSQFKFAHLLNDL